MIYKTVSEVNIQALPFAHVLLFTCMSVLKALQSLCCMFYTSTFNKICISVSHMGVFRGQLHFVHGRGVI
jgi:hypothetical protein